MSFHFKFVQIIFFLNIIFLTYSQNTDTSSDKSKNDDNSINEDLTDDEVFGNKWYSRRNFLIINYLEMGQAGSIDYLTENLSLSFQFKSKTRHAFSIRFNHIGFVPGLFSGNFTFYNFGIFTGFEYFFKLFTEDSGFRTWIDLGGCQNGFAVTLGLGIGSKLKNGFDFWISYLLNTAFFSRLEFYFYIAEILTLKGRLGIDIKFTNYNPDFFNFLNGFFIGIFIKEIFKLEIGGGFTFNEYGYFSGFGGINLTFQIK